MRIQVLLLLLVHSLFAYPAFGAERYREVEIADPYIELHTGPGRGYPVFHVVERGAAVQILKSRTDWYKVRTDKGREGWVYRDQLARTLTAAGEPLRLQLPGRGDFSGRRWEMGALGGDFGGASVISVYGGYAFTQGLSAELSLSQILGDFSDSMMVNANLLAQPFPEWRVSPFFTLGTGLIYTSPQVTLVQERNRTDQIAHVGVGFRAWATRRFVLRGEYRNYVIFQNKDDNQEIDEWKLGFTVFF